MAGTGLELPGQDSKAGIPLKTLSWSVTHLRTPLRNHPHSLKIRQILRTMGMCLISKTCFHLLTHIWYCLYITMMMLMIIRSQSTVKHQECSRHIAHIISFNPRSQSWEGALLLSTFYSRLFRRIEVTHTKNHS